ncbi:MAG: methyltransferase domain-containing protein [Anaerolineae bacterium]|nr:methyltransferase domain-containing protein [Anaerolineae bacterium]
MGDQSLLDVLLNRHNTTAEWQKIPWHDPDFSRRMLAEHLSQDHDLASRRYEIIDQHVDWIHRTILDAQPAAILDLGCGPGLYMDRLVKLGHTCTGIDFSPASIDYARRNHAGTYRLDNIVTGDYGTGFDLVMLIYGELNAFAPEDAQRIIDKTHRALRPGGKLLLEVMSSETIKQMAGQPPTWYTAESGLFSDHPHLCLQESRFESGRQSTTYYVIEEDNEDIQTYTAMHHPCTDDEYRQMLDAFEPVIFYPSPTDGFFCIAATK